MILTQASYKVIRENFGSLNQSQVDAFEFLVKGLTDAGFTYPEAAYALATVWHETDKAMLPVIEKGGQKYLRGKSYYPYIGYGYVQLTHEDNYKRIGTLLGIDLISKPERALEPKIALAILTQGMLKGWFTGVGFRKKRPVLKYDRLKYKAARSIINLQDKADLIAGYAMIFEKALRS